MKTHTPGPWAYDKDSNEIFSCNEAHGCGWVALVKGNDSNGQPLPGEERHGNARLIAAAPELLDALKSLFADWVTLVGEDLKEQSDDVALLWKCCEAAIAKAEGAAK